VTKRVPIEKSKLFFVIPKTISVIPYPYNFLVNYPLSLKLFCYLSLIPKAPNRASMVQEMKRQNCKAFIGIHWDEMIIQEGIAVFKI